MEYPLYYISGPMWGYRCTGRGRGEPGRAWKQENQDLQCWAQTSQLFFPPLPSLTSCLLILLKSQEWWVTGSSEARNEEQHPGRFGFCLFFLSFSFLTGWMSALKTTPFSSQKENPNCEMMGGTLLANNIGTDGLIKKLDEAWNLFKN